MLGRKLVFMKKYLFENMLGRVGEEYCLDFIG